MNKKLPLLLLLMLFSNPGFPWGFFAHQHINRMAVYSLPPAMIRFYKQNIRFITEHAVDPDKRRYADTAEAPRHFIDIDRYRNDTIPKDWKTASEKYTEEVLYENGIVPWQIQRSYYKLVAAFRDRDSLKILRLSSDLGHYVADAHVPLHTTENYNGQLSGQVGIHGFWESRLPELFHREYNFFLGRANYVSDVLEEAWGIVGISQSHCNAVLLEESRLNNSFPSDLKYSYSERNGRLERQYSEEYSRAYHSALKGMVEERMRSSILKTSSLWFSAWVDAGQPDLTKMNKTQSTAAEVAEEQKNESLFRKGKIIGREEN